MLTKHENEQLTRVGAGTPMGELMRRYWHPIAAMSQLDGNPTKAVRLLGEDLVLYKDRSGAIGLIGDRCPHRKVNLLYGIPEQDGLRCPYHGWLFNADGRCTEQPYEQAEDPSSNFKDKISLVSYPVRAAGGLLFAYLGPQPVPELPCWDLLVWENVYRDIGFCVIPCNYLQIMENSVDPIHAEWLHGYFSNYVWERVGHPERAKNFPPHKKIGFDVYEHGIIKRRILQGETGEDPNWKLGHPLVFPNLLKVGGFQWRVPVDDEHTLHIWYYTYAPAPGTIVPKNEPIPVYEVPVPQQDERGLPRWDVLDFTAGQDIVMWHTQGAIADRSTETLGRSDRGIILYRRLLRENMEKVARGEDPINVFRNPEQ
ncbi:MAG: Rieske 2Fe-2S domain-containing protein, partial [Chloroflexota bacterium]